MMRPIRVLAVTVLAAALLALSAAPAAAHGRGADAGNFRSRITATPPVEGLHWRVLHADDLLWLRNDTDDDVVVLGHEGEPYLRIGPDGAFENANSPTVALHRERYATDLPPGDRPDVGDNGASDPAPEWEQVGADPEWSWHDHRIHWMSPRPPEVDGETVLIPRWEVPIRVGEQRHVLAGELRWIPPPPPWPWLVAALALAAPALLGLRTATAPDGTWPRGLRPAAGVVAAVALLDGVHLVNDLSGPEGLEARVFTAAQTLLYLALALGGAVRARKGDYAGLTALGVGSFALFLGQGLLFLPVLVSSQIGGVVPDWFVRLTVAASLVQLVPVGVVLWRAGRRLQPGAQAQATSSS